MTIDSTSADVAQDGARDARLRPATRLAIGSRVALSAVVRSVAAALLASALLTAFALCTIAVGFLLVPTLSRLLLALARHAGRDVDIAVDDAVAQPLVQSGRWSRDLDRTLTYARHATLWRTVLWACTDWAVVWVTIALGPVVALYGIFGVAVQPFVWRPIDRAGGSNWYGFVHVRSTTSALVGVALGVVLIASAMWTTPMLERAYRRWLIKVLSPSQTQLLRARNHALTLARADVVTDREVGLAKIQRDLHDGAQARLVAMGMNLDQAARALDVDPARARLLLAEAQSLSTSALAELRALVHGIHSPVLADRGLADAVRSLVLDTGYDGPVTSTLASRPASPVEGAAYYALAELIANAAKHSTATNLTVDISHDGATLIATVVDNGQGGADPTRGTGLTGIVRRVGAFDGVLTVDSPTGGPTIATVRIPCELS